ncbi:DUF262 domain-containing protein [Flavobacterium sp. CF136]|uniref:DUF262 domain-containing protein n=1 Tax=Flavobacterium sp. (strain CF136) TaxID=1144313 RepID=UPI000271966E|nr:DUF262 domain-containing protein [Flavobacterium sp. CF136]EJL64932.1 Protein of unknown function DUF262 [Flavobacterium sp. CF136]
MISEEKLNSIEEQIKAEQQSISYDIKDFTIEYYVQKYLTSEEEGDNELYVPDYQREFIWEISRQSKFIESIILGLPIPLIFVAEIEDTGRLEIVDGSQRIRTLAAFVNDKFKLIRLETLTELNGFTFSQLKPSRQRLIKNSSMRMIVLSSRANEEIRNDMFGRINTSSVPLLGMETRRGIFRGKFMDFITKLAESKRFKKLCPIDKHFENRREEEELILRYFAFSAGYLKNFNLNGINLKDSSVTKYIDRYLQHKNETCTDHELEKKENDFNQMLDFVELVFKDKGFGKFENSQATSRPYFEAIAIGSSMALKSKKKINTKDLTWSIIDKKNHNDLYKLLSGRYHTHKPKTLKARIDYVFENLTKE